jgi:hypothetical protein
MQTEHLSVFALISSQNDLNGITIGFFLQHYLVINQKYKRNISIHRKRRYDQPRATFG